ACLCFCVVCCILSLCLSVFFFFFFQAEDGIRDWSVTGVQTCALPICIPGGRIGRARTRRFHRGILDRACRHRPVLVRPSGLAPKIGRASCRERGEVSGGGGLLKKKRKKRRRMS